MRSIERLINIQCDRSISGSNLSKPLVYALNLLLLAALPLQAQVIPDNSLGNERSIVTPNVTIQDDLADLIEGGAIRGENLFHSFEQFSIPEGNRVYFASPNGIANILTRVTGNNISEIFGTLGTDGAANLFLLNPNGIVFGENAILDLNGSFLATTAESYLFENGFTYSAIEPEIPPLLTINIPVGLQMSNSGKIAIQDSGHSIGQNIIRYSELAPGINFDDNGLKIKPNRTFSLIGNQIELDGGIIISPEGEIQLGSVAQGKVKLNLQDSNSWSIDYTEVKQFQDINLLNRALIDISGNNTGVAELRGRNIIIKDTSEILANTYQDNFSNLSDNINIGKIAIEAEGLVEITGIDEKTLIHAGIISHYFGKDKGISIDLKSKNLIVDRGGFITATAQHTGESGDINLQVSDRILVNGFNVTNSILSSGIIIANFAGGNGGNLTIDTNQIEVLSGGNITSSVVSTGEGGDININAEQSITVSGFEDNTFNPNLIFNPSLISSISFNQGDAGNLNINTSRLIVRDGGRIDSTTISSGNAGNLSINASEFLEISSSSNSLIPSSINSAAILNPVPIIQQVFALPDLPSGDAGNLTIATPRLKVIDGADITVRNDGLGNGGNLNINADSIVLETRGNITASTVSGNGGDISLKIADLLILRDRGLISAEAQSIGNGGNIFIDANAIAIVTGSSIDANAIEGNGGNIGITTQGLFVADDSSITASSQFGLDGNVEIETLIGSRELELDSLPNQPVDAAQQITTGCSIRNDFTIAGKGGLPANPTEKLMATSVWQDLRVPEFEIARLNTKIPVKPYSISSKITEASNWRFNSQGNIELVADDYSLPNYLSCFQTANL